MITYRPSYTKNEADKTTNNITAKRYSVLDTALSINTTTNVYQSARGLSYRWNKPTKTFMIGRRCGQPFERQSIVPEALRWTVLLIMFLPTAMFTYKMKQNKKPHINYRTTTRSPSVTHSCKMWSDHFQPAAGKIGKCSLNKHLKIINNCVWDWGNRWSKKLFIFLMRTKQQLHHNAMYLIRSIHRCRVYTINRGSQLIKPCDLNNYYSLADVWCVQLPLKRSKQFKRHAGYT